MAATSNPELDTIRPRAFDGVLNMGIERRRDDGERLRSGRLVEPLVLDRGLEEGGVGGGVFGVEVIVGNGVVGD